MAERAARYKSLVRVCTIAAWRTTSTLVGKSLWRISGSPSSSTRILNFKEAGSVYVDYSVFAAHHMRTAKSQKFEGMIVGADGYLCRMEQKGPPDHATYEECSAVHECGIIMARMVTPPRIHHYRRMQADFAREYPECWPLQYQQDDGFRYEQFPQALRKLHAQADRPIASIGFLVASDEESTFGPSYPFEHILW